MEGVSVRRDGLSVAAVDTCCWPPLLRLFSGLDVAKAEVVSEIPT